MLYTLKYTAKKKHQKNKLLRSVINTLTPGSDYHVTSHYNIHTLSSKQVKNYSDLSHRSCCFDLTLNSHDSNL